MQNHKKKPFLSRYRYFILILINSLLISCISVSLRAPTHVPSPTTANTNTETVQPNLTPEKTETIFPSPFPTETVHEPIEVPFPHFETIPLGEKTELVENDSHFSFRVKAVYTGKKAQEMIYRASLPEGMQWVIVIPEMKYVSGPKDQRVQLVYEDLFHIISNGHLLKNDFTQYTPVSNYLNSIKLLPGETSEGYLIFGIYQDDRFPVMKYENQGKDYYFALTKEEAQYESEQVEGDWFQNGGPGSQINPVPLQDSIIYSWNGNILQISIDQVKRGLAAIQKIESLFGTPPETTGDQEIILPHIHIRLLKTENATLGIPPGLFNVSNSGELVAAQPEWTNPMPFLNNLFLYPGGEAQGWIPMITSALENEPLLVFNQELYLSLGNKEQSQQDGLSKQLVFSENEITGGNIKDVKQSQHFDQKSLVYSLAFSPDNRWLASTSDDRKVHIWDVETGKEVALLEGSKIGVKSVAFSRDAKWLASVSDDEMIRVWNTEDWSLFQSLEQGGKGVFAGFLNDGTLVTVNQSVRISFWDLRQGIKTKQIIAPISVHPSCTTARITGFDMTWDGTEFAAALDCGYGIIWNPNDDSRYITHYNYAIDSGETPYSSAIALSQTGNLSAYGGVYYENYGYLVEIANLERKVVLGGVGTATTNIPAIAFNPNGKLIAVAIGPDVRIWWRNGDDWPGQKSVDLKGHQVQVTALKFSDDASLLASGDYQGMINIWRVAN